MNRAFGFQAQTPIIQFNSLQSDAEQDEQRGLMFLYKGLVGLRNSKAHSNRLFDDAHRAHEYLALASLLMRLLEIAQYNPTAGGADIAC
ncbi:MAG: TIGR02391 family protein [Acidobacteria bacterium]|nr:TIGR02391 family protein [Acidobacteriota bacterium]